MTEPHHIRPVIENSDRGITLNKPLAWTIAVSLAGLVWYGGTTVSQQQMATEGLTAALVRIESTIGSERAAASAIEARVRALENLTTRQDARFDALSRSMDELKEQQRETNTLLRRMSGVAP